MAKPTWQNPQIPANMDWSQPWTSYGTPQATQGEEGTQGGGFHVPQVMSPEEIEIASLDELRRNLTGLGNYYYRKMIDARIQSLKIRIGKRDRPVSTQFDIPDWMKPLINVGQPYQTERDVLPQASLGNRKPRRDYGERQLPKGTGQLAPLGAQTELSVDQQRFLQGYVGWGKGGFATSGGAPAIQRMAANQQAAWQEYIRQSQSMFPPSQRLGVTKKVASQ